MMNVRSYRKIISELKIGDTFYFNAINASISMIAYTRQLIQSGKIAPDNEELNKAIKPEVQNRYRNGQSIAPQMVYRIIS